MTAASPFEVPPSSPLPGAALPPPTPGLVERLVRDPNAIWMREMRQSARLGRTPWVLFTLTLTLGLLMCCIGGMSAASDTTPAAIGGTLFQVFFSLAYLVVVLVGPAIAANGIASEREGRTWEAVLLTGLRPQDVARGKFLAAYTTLAVYIVVLAPVGALPFLFGGVTATEVVVAFVFLFLVAGLTVAFGLAVSSLMTSLRGAIVVTLMLAILFGPILYCVFGFGASFAIHKLWSEVPEAFPIWLPLAYSRGAFGLDYALLLVPMPLLLLAAPAWFLYEVTIANLSGEADDRSTGLKRWFLVASPLIALGCTVPCAVAVDDTSRVALLTGGLCVFAIHLAFCAFLFAGEPPGPSRRVRVHWEREHAGMLRRFFGPGLPKTGLLVGTLGFACVWLITCAGMALIELSGPSPPKGRHIEEVFLFGLYTAGFFLFVTGLTAWLRSRGQMPWITRLVAAAVLFLVCAGPWVVAAIGGVLTQYEGENWLVIGAPSPFYAVYLVGFLESSHPRGDVPVVELGAACALLWGLFGIALLVAAARRCQRTVRDQDAAVAATDAALRAEDAPREEGAPASAASPVSAASAIPEAPAG
jgi:ABC-type transport system involved in multi-copper enzyme maturation permease subunit